MQLEHRSYFEIKDNDRTGHMGRLELIGFDRIYHKFK